MHGDEFRDHRKGTVCQMKHLLECLGRQYKILLLILFRIRSAEGQQLYALQGGNAGKDLNTLQNGSLKFRVLSDDAKLGEGGARGIRRLTIGKI